MATFIKKLLARHVTITVIPCTELNGVLTELTGFSLTGRAGRVSMSRTKTLEEISGNDSENEHYEIIKRGFELSLEAIKHIAGAELEDLCEAYDYFAVVVASPRSGGTKSRKFYGILSQDSWAIEPGKNLDAMTLKSIDIGTGNPVLTNP